MTVTTEEAERLATKYGGFWGLRDVAAALRALAAERDALQKRVAKLEEELDAAGRILHISRFLVCRDANDKGLTGSPHIGNKEAATDLVSPTITIKVVVANGKAMADGIVNSHPSSDDIRAAIHVLEATQAYLKPKAGRQRPLAHLDANDTRTFIINEGGDLVGLQDKSERPAGEGK